MSRTKLGALCAAALITLSGTAVMARDTTPAGTPYCSKSVTDNCMQREGHAVAARHHAVAKHRTAAKHRVAAAHRKGVAKAAPSPARKM